MDKEKLVELARISMIFGLGIDGITLLIDNYRLYSVCDTMLPLT